MTTKFIITLSATMTLLSGCTGINSRDCMPGGAFLDDGVISSACRGSAIHQIQYADRLLTEGKTKEAINWLKEAAATKVDSTHVYMPPVGGATYGMIMNVGSGDVTPGNAQAMYFLGMVYSSGQYMSPDHKKALKWFEGAEKAGYPIGEQILTDLKKQSAKKK